MEIWENIKINEFEGLYQVSNLGNIKSMPRPSNRFGRVIMLREKQLNPSICKGTGYKNFTMLALNKKRKQITVHRCVALAFCKGRTNERNTVNHIDGNRINNNIDNLEWCTPKENSQHASLMGKLKGITGSNNSQSKLTENVVLQIRKRYTKYCNTNGGIALAAEFGVSNVTIHNIIKNKKWINLI